jgi:hypothetical protein
MFNNRSLWEFIFGGTHAHLFSYILIFQRNLRVTYLLTYTIQPQRQSATEKENNIQASKKACGVHVLMNKTTTIQ